MTTADIEENIGALRSYQSGWANDIREGWGCASEDARKIHLFLYMICESIIFGMQQLLNHGYCRDKMTMILVKKELEKLMESENFKNFYALGLDHVTNVVTTATIDHINVMFDCLGALTK